MTVGYSERTEATRKSTLMRRYQWLLPIGLLVLALAVRCYGIDDQSIWYDEGWSIHLAQDTLPSALAQIASPGHTHPPGYYLLLMGWERLFGSSVLTMRLLSALLGTATVGAVFVLGRQLYDRTTGMLAALLLALSPAHIVYSQETRMYALLVLACAILAIQYKECALQGERWSWARWIGFVLAQTLAVYTHFFSFFVLAALAGWWALVAWRRGSEHRRRLFGRWLICQGASGVLFLPWLSVALRRATTHATEGALPPSVLAYLDQVWTFMLGGHIALLGREPAYASLARVLAVFVAVLVLHVLWRGSHRRATLYLVVQAALPLAMVWALMQARPGFHPRYVLMVLVPLCVLVAWGSMGLLRGGGWRRGAGVLLLLLWGATTAVAGRALIADPYYDRDDARVTASTVAERLAGAVAPLVLVDNEDWALRYYVERGSLDARFLSLYDLATDDTALLAEALRGRDMVALIKWHQGENDKRGLLPFALERAGRLVETRYLPGYTVSVYDMQGTPPVGQIVLCDASWGSVLRLVEMSVETVTPADEAVTFSCVWQVEAAMAAEYKVHLALIDEGGRAVATRDRVLRDGYGAHTSSWTEGQRVTSFHTLRPNPGTPPVDYALRIGIYAEEAPEGLDLLDEAGAPAGKHLEAARVALLPARKRDRWKVDWEAMGLVSLSDSVEVAPGLALEAWSPVQEHVYTGEPVSVRLAWRSERDVLPNYEPELRLVRDGQILASHMIAPAYGAYATSGWRQGERVLDWRDLTVPVDLEGGAVTLQVGVGEGHPVVLGTIDIESVPRTFERPTPQVTLDASLGPCVLVGYDLPRSTVTTAEDVPLTLYWRTSERMAAPYTVFAHLLDGAGRLIAQHDSPPANGERPTTGWLPGEYVTDAHILRWVDTQYRGEAVIEVGFYDPVSGQRLLTAEGDSRLLLVDSIIVR